MPFSMHTKVVVESHFGLNGKRSPNMLTTVLKHIFPGIMYTFQCDTFFIIKETKQLLIAMNKDFLKVTLSILKRK